MTTAGGTARTDPGPDRWPVDTRHRSAGRAPDRSRPVRRQPGHRVRQVAGRIVSDARAPARVVALRVEPVPARRSAWSGYLPLSCERHGAGAGRGERLLCADVGGPPRARTTMGPHRRTSRGLLPEPVRHAGAHAGHTTPSDSRATRVNDRTAAKCWLRCRSDVRTTHETAGQTAIQGPREALHPRFDGWPAGPVMFHFVAPQGGTDAGPRGSRPVPGMASSHRRERPRVVPTGVNVGGFWAWKRELTGWGRPGNFKKLPRSGSAL